MRYWSKVGNQRIPYCFPSFNCFKSSELPELPAPTPGFWYRDKDLIHLAKSSELPSSLSYLGRPRFRILGGEPRHLTLGELPRWRGHGDSTPNFLTLSEPKPTIPSFLALASVFSANAQSLDE
ncbi:hypothetical protein Salat_2985900 [Sesamum alatum]|uniref:Uncharacterized protein n=1 Tax=Sesamum alatum TaxID=300844 RepID=A0AAE1XIE5_9LAMI|nr:hypothetical protein Salat_2985900 [Sesamum alatum]